MRFNKIFSNLLSQNEVKSKYLHVLGFLSILILLIYQNLAGEDFNIFNFDKLICRQCLALKNYSITHFRNVHSSDIELFIEVEDVFESDSKESEQENEATEQINNTYNNTSFWSILFSRNCKSVNANFLATLRYRAIIPLYIIYQSRKVLVSF